MPSASRIVHRTRRETEIVFSELRSVDATHSDFLVTHENLPPMIKDTALVYLTAALGIMFSTANPSLLPQR